VQDRLHGRSLSRVWLADSAELRALLERQRGVLSRQQAVRLGVPATLIDSQVRCGRWVRLQQGVYATFTGAPDREAVLWSALLRAGPSAALSHQTAAELHGLTDKPSSLIHITVAATQRVTPMTGVLLHHSRASCAPVHPTALPPRTRVEDTVLDLTQSAVTFDDAFGWLCRAVGRRLTTSERLREAMESRPRVRWRHDLAVGLGDVGAGVHSPLERRYVTNVERAHGLPSARRQALVVTGGHRRYVDNLYEDALLAVELDGLAAHPPEQHWADSHRDNELAGAGILTLHYSWHDVNDGSCGTAVEVASVLTMRGSVVRLRSCGPGCSARSRPNRAAT
jgi:very-short-patch-repair endonuclease